MATGKKKIRHHGKNQHRFKSEEPKLYTLNLIMTKSELKNLIVLIILKTTKIDPVKIAFCRNNTK